MTTKQKAKPAAHPWRGWNPGQLSEKSQPYTREKFSPGLTKTNRAR